MRRCVLTVGLLAAAAPLPAQTAAPGLTQAAATITARDVAHRIGGRKLSRKMGPRLALYKNLTVSVLRYERVQTTEAKAKEIRGFVDRMITLAKQGDLAARRSVVAALPNEPLVVNKLFDEIAPKYADRTSGYTRIVKIGARRGGMRMLPIAAVDQVGAADEP